MCLVGCSPSSREPPPFPLLGFIAGLDSRLRNSFPFKICITSQILAKSRKVQTLDVGAAKPSPVKMTYFSYFLWKSNFSGEVIFSLPYLWDAQFSQWIAALFSHHHPLKTWWAPFFTLAFPELQLEMDRAGAQRPSHPLPSPPWRRASREPANTSLPYTSCPGPAVPGVEHWGGRHLKEGLILGSSCLKCDRTNLSHKISLNDFTFTPAMFSDHDGLKLEISYRKVSEKSSNTWN